MTGPLRRLDERLVPRLAEFFDRLIPRPPEPTGPLPIILRLRRLDDRWTQRGPLALMREVPQLGALAIAALVLASGITAASRNNPANRPGAAPGTEQSDLPANGDDRLQIGPQIGDSVDAYVQEARERVTSSATGEPDAGAVAVVTFGQYRTPQQVRDLAGEAAVVRILYRVPLPLPETEPLEAAVADVVLDSKKEFVRRALRLEAEIGNLQSVIDTNDHDPVQKEADIKEQELLRRQVRHLRGDCACIYAVVVETKMKYLLELLAKPGIRVVDVSAPNARLGDYEDYDAVLPEEKVTVTGGNQA